MDYCIEDPAEERQLTRNITYFMRRILPSCKVASVDIDISSVDGSPRVYLSLDFATLPSLKQAFKPSLLSNRRASLHPSGCVCADCYTEIFNR